MKFRTLFLAVATLVCMLLGSCAKDVIDLNGSIKGVVKDADDGHLIENCLVALSPGGVSKTTDQSGVFEFAALTPGEYTLLFTKTGYPNTTKTVTVVTGEETKSDVLLKANSPFALSDENLNFGDLETDKSFYVANNTDAECSYTISNIPEWLTFSKTKGTIGATAQAAISAKIDRNKVDYGSFSHNVIINYSGRTTGQVFLSVKFDKVKLTTPEVTIASDGENITETSFDIKGNLVATGGSQVLNHGHCWSTSKNPTINDYKTELGMRKEVGSFMSTITGLTTYTTYYVRAYAENAQGISYSDEIAVTTQDAYSDKWDGNLASSFAGGKGTQSNPYIIKTGGQLLLMKDYSSDYFELANDINLDNHNWLPFEFEGELDGKGYTISNLKVDRDNLTECGLFSELNYALIENLTIKGVNINSECVGALAAVSVGSEINNCHIILTTNSQLKGVDAVGGFVGRGSSENTFNYCMVKSQNDNMAISGNTNVGGIMGIATGQGAFCFIDCQVVCNISASTYIGGLLGFNNSYVTGNSTASSMKECSYQGHLAGESNIGGITGASIRDSYIVACKADVEIEVSKGWAGGIIGATYHSRKTSIEACYSMGSIMNTGYGDVLRVGGIVGGNINQDGWGNNINNSDSPSYAYVELSYSTVTSTISSFLGIGSKRGESSKYVADCSDITTYFKEAYSEYASHWDFNNQWTWSGTINGQTKQVKCPRLAWE